MLYTNKLKKITKVAGISIILLNIAFRILGLKMPIVITAAQIVLSRVSFPIGDNLMKGQHSVLHI